MNGWMLIELPNSAFTFVFLLSDEDPRGLLVSLPLFLIINQNFTPLSSSPRPEESASPAPTVRRARPPCGAGTRRESRCVTHAGSTRNYTG